MKGYWEHCQYLLQLLRQADFQRFEEEAEISSKVGLPGLIKVIETNLRQVENRRDREADLPEFSIMCSHMIYACAQIAAYAEACTEAATRLLSRTKEIAGEFSL